MFFFKYFNFLGTSINDVLITLGSDSQIPYLKLLLPVGISFYTFQTLSYTIDVYRGEINTEKHFGIYALYISFFPQLVAGPIERSTRLLPQFRENHKLSFQNFIKGIKWIVLGFFMKLVIADRLSLYVDSVYNNVYQHSGLSFLIATILFAFQIFGDFAGYSSIAIGTARIMGYDLMTNFKRPYFATSIGDFWHRWHISLSTWFRDYFYIPIGGSRVGISRWYLNLFLTFLISGLWHGANWTFVIWGALHGIYIVIENIFKLQVKKYQKISLFNRILRALIVFLLVDFAWIFFRANNVADAFYIAKNIFSFSGELFSDYKIFFFGIIGLVVLFVNDLIVESNTDSIIENSKINYKVAIYFAFLVCLILYTGVFNGGQFIYFQF
ncbi:MBOAT family O-acyltransferase [Aureibaculum sp. 2210JD6-5]|nr:MBOAT family O-acyltransferase [Aureibaculum sp. 2210JD6-5]